MGTLTSWLAFHTARKPVTRYVCTFCIFWTNKAKVNEIRVNIIHCRKLSFKLMYQRFHKNSKVLSSLWAEEYSWDGWHYKRCNNVILGQWLHKGPLSHINRTLSPSQLSYHWSRRNVNERVQRNWETNECPPETIWQLDFHAESSSVQHSTDVNSCTLEMICFVPSTKHPVKSPRKGEVVVVRVGFCSGPVLA